MKGLAGRLAVATAVLAAAYVLAAGLLLARGVAAALTVGTLGAALEPAVPVTDPRAFGYRGDPAQALGLDFETAAVTTPLGPIEAWYVPGRRDDLAAVYVHGVAGARQDGFRLLALLAEAGVPTLLIGYRNDPGAPQDPGGRYAMGTAEWADLEAAVAVTLGLGHDRLLLLGDSMGGGIVGQFLARSDLAGHVAGLALDSPALDFQAVLAHVAAARGLPAPQTVGRVALWWIDAHGPHPLRQARVIDTVAGFEGPLLLVHGSADRIVPVAISDRLLARRSGATLHLRTAADHLQSWHEAPEAFRAGLHALLAQLSAR